MPTPDPRPAPSRPESAVQAARTGTCDRLRSLLAACRQQVPAAAALAGRLLAPPWPRRCLVCDEACRAHPTRSLSPGAAGRAPDSLSGRTGPATEGVDLCPDCLCGLPWLRAACARCARPLPAPAAACGRCLRRPPPQACTVAAFLYEAPLDRLLPRLKFHQDLAAGRSLALAMAPAFAAALADAPPPEALVPLPLHRSRLRSRGFDQTLELARPLARALDLPLRHDLLHRQRATAPQSRLDAAARRRNLRDAFVVVPPARGRPLPAHVALFDDVMTTGATVQSAAHALLRAGVARVEVWVCARVG